jgi:hypothetical protein
MLRRNSIVLSATLLCLALHFGLSDYLLAKDEITPEQLVAEHLKSLGTPEALAQIKSRNISGITTLKFITGGTAQMAGTAQWVSEKGKMGIIMQFGATDYPGEHFAYDGKDVMVNYIKTGGERSPLGNFLLTYDGIMRNGLLGGVLYTDWPLLNVQESKPKMKIKKRKVEDRELLEVEYMPKKSMEDVKVKLYFDPVTYQHVMTEYRLVKVSMGQSLSAKAESTDKYLLTEKFEDFKAVDGIALPFKYSLNYQYEGFSSLTVLYTIDAQKIGHNAANIDPRFYSAQK